MYIALSKNGRKVSAGIANYVGEYFCQTCGEQLVLKRGEIRNPHFAHKQGSFCSDSWHYDMSGWHLGWQEQFPVENQEVVFEKDGIKHRADVFINDTVIEFQHSRMSCEEFNERNHFYCSLGFSVIWVFDASENGPKFLDYRNHGNMYTWKRPPRTFSGFDFKNSVVKVFFETDVPIWERCNVDIPLRELKDQEQIQTIMFRLEASLLSIDWMSPRGFYRFITDDNHHYDEVELLRNFAKMPMGKVGEAYDKICS